MLDNTIVKELQSLADWFQLLQSEEHFPDGFPRQGDLVYFVPRSNNCAYFGAIERIDISNNTAYVCTPSGDILQTRCCDVVGTAIQACAAARNKVEIDAFMSKYLDEDVDDEYLGYLVKAWCIANNKDL